MTRLIALTALTVLGLSGAPFHEPFHARAGHRPMDVLGTKDR